MAEEQEAELQYYRSVEDFFASLRGVPHTLSPKDFELLREWWHDGVPLSAVRAGIAEVMARRRDRGEVDDVVSLGYCRHGVRRHARRIAEMHVGTPEDDDGRTVPLSSSALDSMVRTLREVADLQRATNSRLADIVSSMASSVEDVGELPPAAASQHLYALESSLLARCLDALEPGDRDRIEHQARASAASAGATDDARTRAFRAHRDRLLRKLLGLPRLEL